MPRARVLNASFVASAELPTLPFLAPRVFAESPVARSRAPHGRKRYGSQKEKETAIRDGHGLRQVGAGPATGEKPWADSGRPFTRYKSRGLASGLLHTSLPRHTPLENRDLLAPVGLCYSGISNYVRQHSRGYRTIVPGRRKPLQRAETPAVDRKSSILYRRGPTLAARREVALVLERQRLARHISHEPGLSVKTRLKQGKYRSLHRRIENLQLWDKTVLDLRQYRGGSTKPLNLIRAFAALDRSLYPSVARHTRKITIRHDPRCARWSFKVFKGATKHELHQAWKNWLNLDTQTRRTAYQRLLVYLLDRKPGRAMQYIHVLANDPLLRGRKTEAIADALGHLSKVHRRGKYNPNEGWSHDSNAVRRSFVPAFFHFFRKALAGQKEVCSQDLLYNLVDLADGKDLRKLFDCFVEHRTFLSFDTILHYANAFAKAGDFTSALRCLEELKKIMGSGAWDTVSDRQRLRWTCALILRKSIAKGEGFHNTAGIVASIVQLGIEMDILLYNVVMHNAMDAGDYSTAFKIYNTLQANGLKADKHTYSILLHGCALQSDPATFSRFAQHCADVAKKIEDPWLATDYLHYLYVRHQNDSDKAQTLDLLQQQYLRFFSAGPLQLISSQARRTEISSWLYRSLASAREESTHTDRRPTPTLLNLQPTSTALYIMLQAQIQAVLAISSQQVLELYHRFRTLVQQDSDAALTKLASDPIIWNAFLLAFCSKQQFASASELIKDMTEGSPQPNIYSWNIFMQAFFKTSQVQAAERVFKILRSRGINPDGFTYGVLLRGYARAQHIERVGEIMQHVDSEQEMKPDLLKMLAKVLDRDKLMLTLDKSRVLKEVQVVEKARIDAEEEEGRWREPQLTDDELEVALPAESASEDGITRVVPEEPEHEEKDFLGQPLTPEPESPAEIRQPAPVPPSPPKEPLSPFDPEYQYRKLQQELGILDPTSTNQSEPAPPNPLGTTLGFKTMLSNATPSSTITKTPKKSRLRRAANPRNPLNK